MTQLTRCKCGHTLLQHYGKSESCKHPKCKCCAFKQEGTATLADALKPDSINILLALKHKLAIKPTIINIYGNFRTFTAVGQNDQRSSS